MAIKFGQTVKDRFTQQIVGVSVGRCFHADHCDQIVVRPLTGGNVLLQLVDEWRLEARGNLLQRFGKAIWQFVKSENGAPSHLRLGLVTPCLVALITAVMFLRCRCQ